LVVEAVAAAAAALNIIIIIIPNLCTNPNKYTTEVVTEAVPVLQAVRPEARDMVLKVKVNLWLLLMVHTRDPSRRVSPKAQVAEGKSFIIS
jgi:hypothetical protein